MKLMHSKSGYDIALSENERHVFSGNRVAIYFGHNTGDDFYIKLVQDPGGSVLSSRADQTHPYRLRVPRDIIPNGTPFFGTELVKTISPGVGTIYVPKPPKMDNKLQTRSVRNGIKTKRVPDFKTDVNALKQAVHLINNTKDHYKDQLHLEINPDGHLSARFEILL